MLREGFYSYEYMDDLEKFYETLPKKEAFYSHLNIEDITDKDDAHAKRVCKDFRFKKLGEYHDLYVQGDTLLLLADVFENIELCVLKYANVMLLVSLIEMKNKYWHVNNLCGQEMSQMLPINDLKWVEDISKFNEIFITSCNEESDEGYFFEFDIEYPENLHNLHNNLPFFPERMKTEKRVPILHDKQNMLFTYKV